jgi:hypothetical protein
MLLPVTSRLIRRDRSGLALSGMPASGTFGPGYVPGGQGGTTCGFFGCDGAVLPAYYSAGLAVAQANHYSVPINSVWSGLSVGIVCVNPDGTIVRVDGWKNWPPTGIYGDQNCYPGSGSKATCNSFVPPDRTTWNGYMVSLGVQNLADQAQANYDAAILYAQQAQQNSNPGTPPGGSTGSSGGGGLSPSDALTQFLQTLIGASGQGSGTGSSGGPGGSGGSSGSGSQTGGCAAGSLNLAGFCVPLWGLAAGLIGIALVAGGK